MILTYFSISLVGSTPHSIDSNWPAPSCWCRASTLVCIMYRERFVSSIHPSAHAYLLVRKRFLALQKQFFFSFLFFPLSSSHGASPQLASREEKAVFSLFFFLISNVIKCHHRQQYRHRFQPVDIVVPVPTGLQSARLPYRNSMTILDGLGQKCFHPERKPVHHLAE